MEAANRSHLPYQPPTYLPVLTMETETRVQVNSQQVLCPTLPIKEVSSWVLVCEDGTWQSGIPATNQI